MLYQLSYGCKNASCENRTHDLLFALAAYKTDALPLSQRGKYASAGNRTRVRGLEDPHSTTEILTHLATPCFDQGTSWCLYGSYEPGALPLSYVAILLKRILYVNVFTNHTECRHAEIAVPAMRSASRFTS